MAMTSKLEEELVCAICLKIFQEPHILGCSHSYCLACLKSCIPEGQEEGRCPECRDPFQLQQLIYNRSLGNVAEEVRSLRGGDDALPVRHICKDHEEPLKLFCKKDEEPICVICRDLPQHRGHDFVPTKNAVELAQNCTEDNLSYISREFEAFRQLLNEKEEEMIKTIQDKKKKNLDEMEEALTSLKEEISLRSDCIEKIKEALVTTDHVAFLKDFKGLMEKIQALEDANESEEESEEEENEEESEEEENEMTDDVENSSESREEEDEEEHKKESEDEDSYSGSFRDSVVYVEQDLKEFKTMFNFEEWKDMLEGMTYGHNSLIPEDDEFIN
uniref:Uncharacterized protein n=1 Tax=Salvator merianae TaxID=96440 RepID=A0A8D0BBG4_SALMN